MCLFPVAKLCNVLANMADFEIGVNVGVALGFLLLIVVLSQTVLSLVSTAGRSRHEQLQYQLDRERLGAEIELAKARLGQVKSEEQHWNGYRKFEVSKKVEVCRDVYAFDLVPHDKRPLPWFKPGQYLTFGLKIPGEEKDLVRCYSLSSSPTDLDCYRVTIKKEPAPPDKPDVPPGRASNYFADVVKEGDILDSKAPMGHFFLDLEKNHPIVLLAGGVGVTPMLSMAQAVADGSVQREVHFFFGCRSGEEHIHREEIEALDGVNGIKVHICYSRPREEDQQGRDYDHQGRVSPDLLREVLGVRNYEFYMCGNGNFMNTLHEGLVAWGVPEKKIHYEAFGPATVKKKSQTIFKQRETLRLTKKDLGPSPKITFAKSKKTVEWNEDDQSNLWEFAQANDVRIDYSCGTGQCGSCKVAIKSGQVEYLSDPNDPEDGCCFTCVSVPKSDLVLDA